MGVIAGVSGGVGYGIALYVHPALNIFEHVRGRDVEGIT